MTGITVEQEMLNIALSMKEAVSNKISLLDSQHKTAMKAYRIAIAMIDQSCKMVSMKFSPQSHDEKYYSVREDRIFKSPGTGYFIDQKEWYEKETNTEKKQAFLVYAHAVQMVRSAFLDKKIEELKKAQHANAVEAKFEIKMVIDTLNDLLDAWEKWWNELWENFNA